MEIPLFIKDLENEFKSMIDTLKENFEDGKYEDDSDYEEDEEECEECEERDELASELGIDG